MLFPPPTWPWNQLFSISRSEKISRVDEAADSGAGSKIGVVILECDESNSDV